MQIKSPFLINQDYLPIKLCESLIDIAFVKDDSFFSEHLADERLHAYIQQLNIQIETHFNTKIKSTISSYDTYDTNVSETHRADNSVFKNGTWYRNKDIDFTTIIFMKDGNTKPPIDTNTEVFGGKLEFPTFNFSFNPEVGTSITFPAYPNFLNLFTPPKIGTNHILRLSHESDIMFEYDHSKFPGTMNDWFKHLT